MKPIVKNILIIAAILIAVLLIWFIFFHKWFVIGGFRCCSVKNRR